MQRNSNYVNPKRNGIGKEAREVRKEVEKETNWEDSQEEFENFIHLFPFMHFLPFYTFIHNLNLNFISQLLWGVSKFKLSFYEEYQNSKIPICPSTWFFFISQENHRKRPNRRS